MQMPSRINIVPDFSFSSLCFVSQSPSSTLWAIVNSSSDVFEVMLICTIYAKCMYIQHIHVKSGRRGTCLIICNFIIFTQYFD